MKKNSFRLGCDIGGTFTDFVLFNNNTGKFNIYKCLTTQNDPSEAIKKGIKTLKKKVPKFNKNVSNFIHGTTLVINAVIERKGSKTLLITTKGFKDVLELGRELRYDSYDLFSKYPKPLVERNLRVEIKERINSDGKIITKLDTKKISKIAKFIKHNKINSIAICLINSYINNYNEKKIKNYLKKSIKKLFISASYEVLPQIKEFERTSTTVVNAYVKPITNEYLKKLSSILISEGIKKNIFVMLSNGTITTTDIACKFPVRIIESGPSAAVIASQYYGKIIGIKNMFCFDMGGTTAKSCLIKNGNAGLTSNFEIGRIHRFKKGSGIPIQVPVLDLLEIGAGGGSIAKINKMGLLQVGPESAGSNPGPACYNLGGEYPTVTDADLILGYINPKYFLGGKMDLKTKASYKSIYKKIAKPLKISITEAAFAIHNLVNETMASAAKAHIAEKGGNPNIITITAFGGAGPIHAYGLVQKIGARNILVPPMPGVGSALGFFTAPIAFDIAKSYKTTLNNSNLQVLEKIFSKLESQAKFFTSESNNSKIKFIRSTGLRFLGQGAETNVTLPNKNIENLSKKEIRNLFDKKYKLLYGRTYPDSYIEFINFKVRAVLDNKPFNLSKLICKKNNNNVVKKYRKAYSTIQKKYIDFAVFDRSKLKGNSTILGPTIIEEKESTTIVGENMKLNVDSKGFLWIEFIK